MKKIITVQIVLLLTLSLSIPLWAGEPRTGREVMDRVEVNDSSRDVKYLATMILIDRNKNRRERKFTNWRIKRGSTTKTMLKFIKPALDKDIGLLTYNYKKRKSDQWIYFPALKETKRILSSDKGKSFMGSDFYYEDFEKKYLDDYRYKLIKKEKFKGRVCYVIESKHRPGVDSAYSKVKSWIRSDNFMVVKSIFYIKGRLAKVLYQRDIKKMQGFWTAREMEMKTLGKKHTTIMILKRVRYNSGLGEAFFTKRFLQRRL